MDGSYLFGYETLDGQKREEEGKVSYSVSINTNIYFTGTTF